MALDRGLRGAQSKQGEMEQQPQDHHWRLGRGAGQSSGTGATASKSLLWGSGQFVEAAALYNDPGAVD